MRVKIVSYLAVGAILAVVAATGQAQTQVSISVGAPGFYGAIDIGSAPPPALVYQQPVAIQPVAVATPLYLYVPPEQYASWGSYCGYYNACNRPVYFVDRNWYQQVYVPHYRSHRNEYAPRQAEFRRYAYREDRHSPPPRADNRRPPTREEYRNAPPRSENRPPVRDEHRNAPPPRPENRPPVRDEHRNAPPPHSGNPPPHTGNPPPHSDHPSSHAQGRDDHNKK